MTERFLDDYDLPITCPKCRNKFSEKVRRLNSNPNIACPSCGCLITIDMKDFNSGADSIEKAIKKAGGKRH